MTVEKRKLELIKRVMKVENSSTLTRLEELFIQAEMEARAEESLEAIQRGEVMTIEEFGKSNQEWLAKVSTK